jgi:hypothetical protein
MKRALVSLLVLLVLAGAAAAALLSGEEPPLVPRETDWSKQGAPSVHARSVYWVGHSLVDHEDALHPEDGNLMDMVGRIARTASTSYAHFEHTLFGAPLSLAWRGAPHSYRRDAPELVERRRELETNAAAWDTLVLTEGIPIGNAYAREHSSYYTQAFYCAMQRRNPEARVYLYEGWVHLYASDPDGGFLPRPRFDWRKRMLADRKIWDRIADEAATGQVRAPGTLARLLRRLGLGEEQSCEPGGPIFTVPVGSALVALRERLEKKAPTEDWRLPDGRELELPMLFQNAWTSWPEGWPLDEAAAAGVDEAAALAALRLPHPDRESDDVHPSRIGIYYAALVHYATLYRRSPFGLPAPGWLGESVARRLQETAWWVVLADPRAGVKSPGDVAPIPFTAREIRDATPAGRTYVFAVRREGGPMMQRIIEFTKVDEKGASLRMSMKAADGSEPGPPRESEATWAEFVGHATYPGARTVIEPTEVEVPLGRFRGRRYRVLNRTDEGGLELTDAVFADELPGAPVRHVVSVDGKEISFMELVEHRR